MTAEAVANKNSSDIVVVVVRNESDDYDENKINSEAREVTIHLLVCVYVYKAIQFVYIVNEANYIHSCSQLCTFSHTNIMEHNRKHYKHDRGSFREITESILGKLLSIFCRGLLVCFIILH